MIQKGLLIAFCFLITYSNNVLLCNQPVSAENNAVNKENKNNPELNSNDSKPVSQTKNLQNAITPEQYGATGDGKAHKLSERYNKLEDAKKDYPNVKDLNITFDGAAFQKAIDAASGTGKIIIAEKNYLINFPLITRDDIVIDGKNKGKITNDRSRPKGNHHIAFYFGDHSSSAFYNTSEKGKYIMYDVKGSVTAGQDHVQLSDASAISSFKPGQLVLLTSSYKRARTGRKLLLPYHISMCRIVKKEGANLYFEYPIDESVSSVEIAANGNYDPSAEVKFEGVQNVTLRNMTVDAEHLTLRTYGYKCNINNVKVVNGIRVIGLNAMAHSSLTDISGTFAWRCIEIKTGSSDVLVRNISATYKPLPDFPHCTDVISLGEYNRNIIIDSFKIDMGNESLLHPVIDLHARKATIKNGIVYCKNQKKPFIKFYNETYIDDPKFGCYSNVIQNIKFYGSPQMKSVLDLGDDEMQSKPKQNRDPQNRVTLNKQRRINNTNRQSEPQPVDSVSIPPSSNIIENCLFDGGDKTSVAALNQGQQNIVRNCTFTRARLKVSSAFKSRNTVSGNKETN